MTEQQSSKARVCENDLRIIYEHGQPHGIRDRSGYLFFFRKVWKYDGQEERYRRELEQMARLADFLLDALKRSTDEPSAGVKCTHCNGTGYGEPIYDEQDGWIDETPCETCNGSGRITTVEQYLKTLPANWHEDSSLETWFPITAEELKRLKDERASQPPTVAHLPTRCADEHQEITFVGERCPLCEALGLLAKEKATTERLEKRVKDARELLVAWFNYDSEDVQFQRPPTDATKRFLGIAAVTKSATVPVLPTSEEDERIVDAAIKRRLSAETNEAQCNGNCFLIGGPFVAEDPSCPKHGNR